MGYAEPAPRGSMGSNDSVMERSYGSTDGLRVYSNSEGIIDLGEKSINFCILLGFIKNIVSRCQLAKQPNTLHTSLSESRLPVEPRAGFQNVQPDSASGEC